MVREELAMRYIALSLVLMFGLLSSAYADSLSSRPVQSGGGGGSTVVAMSAVAVNAPADTNENIVATITIPANTLLANGCAKWWAVLTENNNANNKTWNVRLGGIGGTVYFTRNGLNTTGMTVAGVICNRNSASSQIGALTTGMTHTGTSFTGGVVTSSVNTAASTTLVITATKATAGDTMTVESYLVEAFPQS